MQITKLHLWTLSLKNGLSLKLSSQKQYQLSSLFFTNSYYSSNLNLQYKQKKSEQKAIRGHSPATEYRRPLSSLGADMALILVGNDWRPGLVLSPSVGSRSVRPQSILSDSKPRLARKSPLVRASASVKKWYLAKKKERTDQVLFSPSELA